jgi:hypothetical protein
MVIFRGHSLPLRSAKEDIKKEVVPKDDMDEQTRDEKDYLGLELFSIL